jgi:hypothetical protein
MFRLRVPFGIRFTVGKNTSATSSLPPSLLKIHWVRVTTLKVEPSSVYRWIHGSNSSVSACNRRASRFRPRAHHALPNLALQILAEPKGCGMMRDRFIDLLTTGILCNSSPEPNTPHCGAESLSGTCNDLGTITMVDGGEIDILCVLKNLYFNSLTLSATKALRFETRYLRLASSLQLTEFLAVIIPVDRLPLEYTQVSP